MEVVKQFLAPPSPAARNKRSSSFNHSSANLVVSNINYDESPFMQRVEPIQDPEAAAEAPTEAQQAVAATDESGAQKENAFVNPYIRDLNEQFHLFVHGRDRHTPLTEIAHLAWNGGEYVINYITRSGLIEHLALVVKNPLETPAVKMKIMQCLSVVARNHRANQDLIREHGYLEEFVEFMADGTADMRKWAVHCMFFTILGNATSQQHVRAMEEVKVCRSDPKLSFFLM
eukprot:TRINITY_DN9609_c0_g2_i3.p1 TRINITY_DN9609_c0_g2~~TRINITY_DN9609_c0_g2_i3.p1  ORF type:complete len:230 (+),score=52.14 TRINITY_DN9609_c0_g2_i3:47-736(+)